MARVLYAMDLEKGVYLPDHFVAPTAEDYVAALDGDPKMRELVFAAFGAREATGQDFARKLPTIDSWTALHRATCADCHDVDVPMLPCPVCGRAS